MEAKPYSTVELVANGRTRVFDVGDAERLLHMQNNGGWQLTDNSKFEFDSVNGLTFKRHKRNPKTAEK